MIIVNVKVPALEKVYNFSVEEKAKVSELIEELVELIKQKERVKFDEKSLVKMTLCSIDNGEQFNWENTLNDYGICGGAELILV